LSLAVKKAAGPALAECFKELLGCCRAAKKLKAQRTRPVKRAISSAGKRESSHNRGYVQHAVNVRVKILCATQVLLHNGGCESCAIDFQDDDLLMILKMGGNDPLDLMTEAAVNEPLFVK
jgi:hypothetical protein